MRKYSLLSFICIFIFLSFYLPASVYGQVTSSGIAQTVPLNQNVVEGDIICAYETGLAKCNQEYDSALYGVYTTNPAAIMEDPEMENGKPVVRDGLTQVRVNGQGGPIANGDLVTSSSTEGVGMKANANGFVLGTALDDYNPSNTEDTKTIQVLVNIHPATTLSGSRGNLIQFIRKGAAVPVFQPIESLRYLLAIIIILISFTLGLIYFGRASRAGIEAIGRNPLAKRVIQLTVFLNIVLTLVIVLVGLAIAYLVLVF